MNSSKTKKWLGALVAAVTLTLVTSVAPASAADKGGDARVGTQRFDTGWDIP